MTAAFYHLKNITKVRLFLFLSNTERLMHTFITSRIDYCSALLSGLPKNTVHPLQLIQNSAAKTRQESTHQACFRSLHWLPVSFRVNFKILSLVFRALHGLAPDDISAMLLVYEPGKPLRSSGSSPLAVPQSRTKTLGAAAFSHYTQRLFIWKVL